jgi:hypothetical protein
MEPQRRFVDFTSKTGQLRPTPRTETDAIMEPLFYVMAIMGCGDGSAACAQARVETAQYQSISQCQAAMPAALARNSDLDYPVVSATCQAKGERLAQNHTAHARG